jgi:hypothetical protein
MRRGYIFWLENIRYVIVKVLDIAKTSYTYVSTLYSLTIFNLVLLHPVIFIRNNLLFRFIKQLTYLIYNLY